MNCFIYKMLIFDTGKWKKCLSDHLDESRYLTNLYIKNLLKIYTYEEVFYFERNGISNQCSVYWLFEK